MNQNTEMDLTFLLADYEAIAESLERAARTIRAAQARIEEHRGHISAADLTRETVAVMEVATAPRTSGLLSALSRLAIALGKLGALPRRDFFAEAAALCRELGLLANIEIKPAAGYEIETATRVAVLAANLWRDTAIQPLISSFSLEVLEVARDLAPQIPRGILFEAVPRDWLVEMKRLQALTLHCCADLLTDAVLDQAAALHIPVLCYTVNSPTQAKILLQRGVAAMFTDRLDLFADETSTYKR